MAFYYRRNKFHVMRCERQKQQHKKENSIKLCLCFAFISFCCWQGEVWALTRTFVVARGGDCSRCLSKRFISSVFCLPWVVAKINILLLSLSHSLSMGRAPNENGCNCKCHLVLEQSELSVSFFFGVFCFSVKREIKNVPASKAWMQSKLKIMAR